MKQVFLFLLLLITLALLWPAPSTSQQAAPSPSPAPLPLSDETIRFTVLTDQGIIETDMASSLPGIVAGEMPASFHTEALKAQAVAARTYILHRMERTVAAHPDADICNDPACCKAYADEAALREKWQDSYETYLSKITAAAAETDGQYLCYQGEPIEAVFHSSSAGATEASAAIWNERAYLVSVESPETSEDVPNFITTVSFSPRELNTKLTKARPEIQLSDSPSAWISGLENTLSGRVESLWIGSEQFTGTQLRSALGLRSSNFTAEYKDENFIFTVSGYGHGVGMSQYGANVYAKQGWTYQEILSHYYPNTQLASTAA